MKKVNWREQCYVSVVARSVANLLRPDKRSLVCGSGEELAEDPLTLSAMKSPAYASNLLLENCDQMVLCTANHTQTGFFTISTNLKHASRSWNLPQAIFIEKKKWSHYFFGSYPRCFVIRARLKFARWFSLELHENDTKNRKWFL